MVSVGGRDVCWWEWSVIVAGFEPDGAGEGEDREEEIGGNREGDVAVRSTDQRQRPSSFLPPTRGDTATCSTPNSGNQTRQLEISFYYEWGEYVFTNKGGNVHVNQARRRSWGSSLSTLLDVDLDPASILCLRNSQRQHAIHQLG